MSALALLRENPSPDEAEVREVLSGNICRCTGYQSIVEGVLLAVERGAGAVATPATTPDIPDQQTYQDAGDRCRPRS